MTPKDYYRLARQYDNDEQYELAVEMYKKSLEQYPHWRVFEDLGRAYIQLEKYRYAITALQNAKEQYWADVDKTDLRETAVFLLLMGNCYAELGEMDTALNRYLEALHYNPAHPNLHYNIAIHYMEMEEAKQAIGHYQRALYTQKNLPDIYVRMGQAYFLDGQFKEGLEAVKQAYDLDPTHLNALLDLGEMYTRLGRLEEAKTIYKQAIEEAPDNPTSYIGLALYHKMTDNKATAMFYLDLASVLLEENEEFPYLNLSAYAIEENVTDLQPELQSFLETFPAYIQEIILSPDYHWVRQHPQIRPLWENKAKEYVAFYEPLLKRYMAEKQWEWALYCNQVLQVVSPSAEGKKLQETLSEAVERVR